jgi:hypothetical protein
MDAPDEFLTIGDFFGDDIGIKGRTIVDKEFPVAVENHSPERRHVLEPDPVALGLESVGRALKNLEEPQPQQEHGEHSDHEEGQPGQSLS